METEKEFVLSTGKSGIPGDLLLLRSLAAKYGLTDLLDKLPDVAGQGLADAGLCGPGTCSNACSLVCTACITCPPDCSLKA